MKLFRQMTFVGIALQCNSPTYKYDAGKPQRYSAFNSGVSQQQHNLNNYLREISGATLQVRI